jgi:caa(3)-type oxidase subunit IV
MFIVYLFALICLGVCAKYALGGAPAAAPAAAQDGHDAHAHEGSHRGTYISVAVGLTVLTVLEVLAVEMLKDKSHLGMVAVLIIMTLVKAFLVAAIFMHLRFERRTLVWVACAPLLFATFLLLGLMPDSAHLWLPA